MAHPYHHALSSVKKWGGTVDDFIAVHSWFRPEQGDHGRLSAPRAAPPCLILTLWKCLNFVHGAGYAQPRDQEMSQPRPALHQKGRRDGAGGVSV